MSRYWNPAFMLADSGGSVPVELLLQALAEGSLVIPDYQRQESWTDVQASAFVGHMLARGLLTPVCVRQVDVPGGARDELVDGQQRLRACRNWLDGRIPAWVAHSGQEVWADAETRPYLQRIVIPQLVMPPSATRADALRGYLGLNRGGTPHTDAEIARVERLLAAEEGRS